MVRGQRWSSAGDESYCPHPPGTGAAHAGKYNYVQQRPSSEPILTMQFSIRRVKCDEARPCCKRCSSTGRMCDGYDPSRPPAHEAAFARPLQPLVEHGALLAGRLLPRSFTVVLDEPERFAFDFFLQKTAAGIKELSPATEWVQLALQFSREAASVAYAMTALGSAHQAQLGITHTNLEQPVSQVQGDVSLRQYNKAIASLQKDIDLTVSCGAPLEPILLACLLLACFEVMQNRGDIAISHLRHGRHIVRQHTTLPATVVNGPDRTSDAHSRKTAVQLLITYEKLGKTVLRQDDQEMPTISLHDAVNHLRLPARILPPREFTSLDQARSYLDDLIDAGKRVRKELMRLAEAQISSSYSVPLDYPTRYCLAHCLARTVSLRPHPQLEATIRALVEGHVAWQTAFAAFEEDHAPPQSRSRIMTMHLQHFFSTFTLSTSRETEEALTDRFSDEFARVLSIAEQYLRGVPELQDDGPIRRTPAGPEKQRTFSLRLGILPAVNLICFKCRDPSTRRRAISLLHRADRREGLFWSGTMAAHAEAIQALETQQAWEVLPPDTPGFMSPTSDMALPESARITEVVLAPDMSKRYGSLRFICGKFDRGRERVLHLLEYVGSGFPIRTEQVGHWQTTLPYD